jgi:uncharacterized delta-60 repeat protein
MSSLIRLRVEPLEDRLAPAAGSLDPTFGTGGIARTTAGVVSRLAAAPDGRVLALVQVGNTGSYSVARFEPDGTLDSTYGTGGVAPVPAHAFTTLTALPDGGALVGWGSADGAGFGLVRVTAAGALDTTFGAGGQAGVVLPSGTQATDLAAVAVRPDGRIILAGDRTTDMIIVGQPTRDYDLVVAQLLPTGQSDPSFGSTGTAVVTFPAGSVTSVFADSLAVQADGRLLIGSEVTTSTEPRGRQYTPAVIRLTSDGQLDPTFGSAGVAEIRFPQAGGSYGIAQAVSVLADGRVLLAGTMQSATQTSGLLSVFNGAARLTAGGQLDPTYGAGGLAASTPFVNTSGSFSAAIDPVGRVVFNSVSFPATPGQGGYSGQTVTRLTVDGVPDPGFGTNGQVSISTLPGLNGPNTSDLNLASALVVQPNGDLLLGGTDQAAQQSATNGLIVRVLGNALLAGFVPPVTGTVAVGGPADGSFQVLSPTGGVYATAGTATAFPGFAGNVRVTTADVTGDGTPDYVVGAGPGGGPVVSVYDGTSGTLVASISVFEAAFTGGVFVAAADLDGDGRAEVVATPDQCGGGRVVVFSVAAGGAATMRASFFGIDDPNFRGGARVALGDVNADGTPDLVVAAGFGGGPRVAVFTGGSVLGGAPARLMNDFFAFPGADAVTLRNGVFVAAGDVTGDGFADLAFGGGPGGAPRVFILSGAVVSAGNMAGAQAAPVANFFVAGNTSDRGGVRLAVTDVDRDNKADVVTGSGEGAPGLVRVYPGANFTTPAEPGAFQSLPVFGGNVLAGGVFVG